MVDPFAVLGVGPSATLDEVRAARRRLAMQLHPDRGGDEGRMREVNRAFDLAVKEVLGRTAVRTAPGAGPGSAPSPAPPPPAPAPPPAPRRQPPRYGLERDEPSFTIDVLPVDAFEALALVAVELGEVVVDDPPYLMDVLIARPACWCRLELLPEAGATTVMLTVGGVDGAAHPAVEEVRDLWIDGLNALGGLPRT